MIIGLTGKYCSGKGMVSEYLQGKGFTAFSLSDMLREKLAENGREITRDNLIEIGNKLRKRHGPGVLGKLAREKIAALKSRNNGSAKQKKALFCVDSIRNPEEAKELKKDPEFRLIFIDGHQLIRFQRMLLRKRENDPETFEEFKKKELREAKGTSKYSQRINDTIKMADFTIKNEGSAEELYKEINKIIKTLKTGADNGF